MDDLDIIGFLHRELIFPKLPLFIPNIDMVQLNQGEGASKRHLILLDITVVPALTLCMNFRFLNYRSLKHYTFLGIG